MHIGNPLHKEVLHENIEAIKKITLLSQVNLVDSLKVEAVFLTSNEHVLLYAIEKARLEGETSEGSETVFIGHEAVVKIVGTKKENIERSLCLDNVNILFI